MVNTKLLDSKIESSGMKVSFIIEKMGISRSAFYKKKDNNRFLNMEANSVLCLFINI